MLETPLVELATSSKKKTFARNKQKLCDKCIVCRHFDICRGGCMKDRVRWNEKLGERESYFCESYKQFFDYTVPRFMQIAAGIKNGSIGRHTRLADKIRLRIEN
ncbi:MAG: SPASM domain-containing protein [Sedimentisphaerales bacterium]|nr:SPASM domain-containing protein [Sedimentisphaerales bacterium]